MFKKTVSLSVAVALAAGAFMALPAQAAPTSSDLPEIGTGVVIAPPDDVRDFLLDADPSAVDADQVDEFISALSTFISEGEGFGANMDDKVSSASWVTKNSVTRLDVSYADSEASDTFYFTQAGAYLSIASRKNSGSGLSRELYPVAKGTPLKWGYTAEWDAGCLEFCVPPHLVSNAFSSATKGVPEDDTAAVEWVFNFGEEEWSKQVTVRANVEKGQYSVTFDYEHSSLRVTKSSLEVSEGETPVVPTSDVSSDKQFRKAYASLLGALFLEFIVKDFRGKVTAKGLRKVAGKKIDFFGLKYTFPKGPRKDGKWLISVKNNEWSMGSARFLYDPKTGFSESPKYRG